MTSSTVTITTDTSIVTISFSFFLCRDAPHLSRLLTMTHMHTHTHHARTCTALLFYHCGFSQCHKTYFDSNSEKQTGSDWRHRADRAHSSTVQENFKIRKSARTLTSCPGTTRDCRLSRPDPSNGLPTGIKQQPIPWRGMPVSGQCVALTIGITIIIAILMLLGVSLPKRLAIAGTGNIVCYYWTAYLAAVKRRHSTVFYKPHNVISWLCSRNGTQTWKNLPLTIPMPIGLAQVLHGLKCGSGSVNRHNLALHPDNYAIWKAAQPYLHHWMSCSFQMFHDPAWCKDSRYHRDWPVIHIRASDCPFSRHSDYHFPRYGFYDWAIHTLRSQKHMACTDVYVMHSAAHLKRWNIDSRVYVHDIVDYLQRSLHVTCHLLCDGSETRDLSALFHAPAVIAHCSSFSFFPGFFGRSGMHQRYLVDLHMRERPKPLRNKMCRHSLDFMYSQLPLLHAEVKNYSAYSVVIRQLRNVRHPL